jgi:hypothetical protein
MRSEFASLRFANFFEKKIRFSLRKFFRKKIRFRFAFAIDFAKIWIPDPRDKFISCGKVLMNTNYQPVKTRPPTLQRKVSPSPLSLTGQKFCVCKATFDQETQYGDIQCDLCQQVWDSLP